MYRQFYQVRDAFYEKHGPDFVRTPEGPIIFSDGAVDQNFGGMGPLNEPPTDELELAKLRQAFWELKAIRVKSTFSEYQKFLNRQGGQCPPEAERLVREDDKYQFLSRLGKRLRTAKRYLRKAKQDVEAAAEKRRSQKSSGPRSFRQMVEDAERGFRSNPTVDSRTELNRQQFLQRVNSLKV